MSDPIIDSVFEKAFNSYADKLFESYPTDEEMKKAYPASPRRAKLYERIARAYKNGHSKRNKLSDYVACSFAGSDMENELDTQKAYTILEKKAKKNKTKRRFVLFSFFYNPSTTKGGPPPLTQGRLGAHHIQAHYIRDIHAKRHLVLTTAFLF